MNSEYFVWTTKNHVTPAQAKKVDKAVKKIDPEMEFVRYYAAGNDTHGWLCRPDDGTNAQNPVRERNEKCVQAAIEILTTAENPFAYAN